ncbi:hypothetical protein [Novosphingobium sp. MMS21-SN21R]|uniref:hypothetical protein n=1 Tax=Novosphingobium sp. MMS21-SN21R TaxID=2969298 RepID=UPI002883F5FF|nr:hypothetical protein [Novosphingobium sp. MMS21-SN21R]MDT0506919.1 hypothetical protein [Novosphingobium sp. MMS21-SN21R]
MTGETTFGTLLDVPLREAWTHEAHRFTPWLAANLDRLSAAIGIPLELTGTEARVGTFSADILARNPADDSIVLIENQLEGSDHTHLGQIMTYLAGLDTHTMIWVAPSFRDEHLSAIRWLNEHTVDPFAFFAVRVRVVRIGDSPLAPLFEVVERPNNWDRRLAQQRRTAEGNLTELGQHRLEFWSHFCGRYPVYGAPDAASSRWAALPGTDAVVVQYLSRRGVGVFVRPRRGGSMEDLTNELAPWLEQLTAHLGAPPGGETSFLSQSLHIDASTQGNWDRLADWLDEQTRLYQAVFESILACSD